MSKYFRPWNIDQTLLLPPNVQDFVPKGHVSRFIVELVRESLDLKEITGSYVSGLGQPPFDPRMMVALLLHGYASGLYSSRRIAKACRERNDFVMIVALDPPDFRTISDFRKRHLKALGALFLQVLKLCETAGLVKLGHVALDGTKIKANASKHKAMSYERMKKREAELKAEVARMLAAAEAADSEEDETFGKDKRGDEMPDWAGDKQKRLAKMQPADAAPEAGGRLGGGDARLASEEERRIEAEKQQQRQAEGRKKPGKPAAPPSDQPDPKSQRNFTDPESRIMKSKDGFVQAYNHLPQKPHRSACSAASRLTPVPRMGRGQHQRGLSGVEKFEQCATRGRCGAVPQKRRLAPSGISTRRLKLDYPGAEIRHYLARKG